jgi:hypothetical protein
VRNVVEVHWPIFMISSTLYPFNLRAIAPEARREWAPIRSNAYPAFCMRPVSSALRQHAQPLGYDPLHYMGARAHISEWG